MKEIQKLIDSMSNINLMKIETQLKQIIDNNAQIEDSLDWFTDLLSSNLSSVDILNNFDNMMTNYTTLMILCITKEKYEICSLIREVIDIEVSEMFRVIITKPVKTIEESDERDEILEEVKKIRKITDLTIQGYINTIMR